MTDKKKHDDGGPAFPAITARTTRGPMKGQVTTSESKSGMTLHDHYVGQAMAGWLASFHSTEDFPDEEGKQCLAENFHDLAAVIIKEKRRREAE